MQQENRTDLMVFIDLAFILLVGFLILTDTAPREIVALPGAPEDPPVQQDRTPEIYNVHFNEELRFLVHTGRLSVCQPDNIELLVSCMTQVSDTSSAALFVLVPRGEAPVQHLVSLLDLCRRNRWRCTVET